MTKKILETVIGLIAEGFSLPKKEVTASIIRPTYKESVEMEYGGGGYVCESGADIPVYPNMYYGCRKYYCPSGRYLFTESLPLEEQYVYQPGCSRCGGYKFSHYAISQKAKPAREKLEIEHTKLSSKVFWLPLSLRFTSLKIPSEIEAYHGSERHIIRGKIPFRRDTR